MCFGNRVLQASLGKTCPCERVLFFVLCSSPMLTVSPAWAPHCVHTWRVSCASCPTGLRQLQSTHSYLPSPSLEKAKKTTKHLQSQLPSSNEAETPNRNTAGEPDYLQAQDQQSKHIPSGCSILLVSIFLPFCFVTRKS